MELSDAKGDDSDALARAISHDTFWAAGLFLLAAGLLGFREHIELLAGAAAMVLYLLILVARGFRAMSAWERRDRHLERHWLENGGFAEMSEVLWPELILTTLVRFAAIGLTAVAGIMFFLAGAGDPILASLLLVGFALWLALPVSLAHSSYEAFRPRP